MDPDEIKRVGRIIMVIHLYKAIQSIVNIIKSNIYFVINLLLPVGGKLAVGSRQLAVKQNE